MKRNKKMQKQMKRKRRGFYSRKREFLLGENRRRATLGLPAVMGMDYPIGAKPWK